jgi:hypothetical protein
LAQAQREHEHQRILREACDRLTKAQNMATECNAQWANNESSEDQLEAEWSRIHLLQASDDPWAETQWATFLNLKEACDHDSEWEHWYSTHDEPSPPFIYPEQRAKAE